MNGTVHIPITVLAVFLSAALAVAGSGTMMLWGVAERLARVEQTVDGFTGAGPRFTLEDGARLERRLDRYADRLRALENAK